MNAGLQNTFAGDHWPPRPAADRVDLWCCAGVTDPACDQFTPRLAPDEQERAARYRFDIDRRRYVGSRLLLRTVLAHYFSCSARQLRFTIGRWGKPVLVPFAGESEASCPSFSLSRSHDVALLAVGGGSEIGVDVEFRRPERADSGIVERQFSEREQAHVSRARDRVAAFFEIWARKEAYIKALGRGLSHPLRTFDTTPDDAEDWTPVRDERSAEVGSGWMVRNVPLPVEDYAGAVAARRPTPSLAFVSVSLADLAKLTEPGSAG